MTHLTQAQADTFEIHGVTFRSFASSATGARHLGARRADFSPGTPGQAHRLSEEEVLLVLEGALQVEVGGESFTVESGDAVMVSAGSLFRVSNETSAPAHAGVTTSLGMSATMEADGQHLSPPWAQ